VGRAGIGDVDVTPDGSTLYAVEMTEGNQTTTWPRLWTVPINGTGASASAGTPVAYDIQKPATFGGVACNGKWHPMGIGMSATTVLVGGVCGNETTEPVRSVTITSSRGVGTYNTPNQGYVELTTSSPHGLSAGNGVAISNFDRPSAGSFISNLCNCHFRSHGHDVRVRLRAAVPGVLVG
jgi:hypothetical protein